MVDVGEIYEDDKNLYEIAKIHFHWESKERFIEFVSLQTGCFYILEEKKFLETRTLVHLQGKTKKNKR